MPGKVRGSRNRSQKNLVPGSSPSGVGRHDTTPGQGWLRIKVMKVILVNGDVNIVHIMVMIMMLVMLMTIVMTIVMVMMMTMVMVMVMMKGRPAVDRAPYPSIALHTNRLSKFLK